MQPTGAGSGSRQLQLTSMYGQHFCPLLWLWNGREDDCYSQMVATWGVHQHPSFINWKEASLMGNGTLTWEIKLQNWSSHGCFFLSQKNHELQSSPWGLRRSDLTFINSTKHNGSTGRSVRGIVQDSFRWLLRWSDGRLGCFWRVGWKVEGVMTQRS